MTNAEFLTRKKKEIFQVGVRVNKKTVDTMCFVRS
jgi:hypothetical protein